MQGDGAVTCFSQPEPFTLSARCARQPSLEGGQRWSPRPGHKAGTTPGAVG